jgi:hypothetical protein
MRRGKTRDSELNRSKHLQNSVCHEYIVDLLLSFLIVLKCHILKQFYQSLILYGVMSDKIGNFCLVSQFLAQNMFTQSNASGLCLRYARFYPRKE